MDNEAKITLGLLKMIHENAQALQRTMAGRLGIALGLANAYFNRCAKKGFIKIAHALDNRYAYYLTPQGFSEKSRLTAEFLSQSLNSLRQARGSGAELLQLCQSRAWMRGSLFGAGDRAKIFTLLARGFDIHLVGVIDVLFGAQKFSGLPVISVNNCIVASMDAVIVFEISSPQAAFDRTCEMFPPERVLAPRFLGVVIPTGQKFGGV